MSHPMDPRRRHLLRWMGMVGTGTALSGLMKSFAQDMQECSDSDVPSDNPMNCSPSAPSGPPVPFTPPTGPTYPRKSAFDLTPREVDRFRTAYQAMRDLTQSNPQDPRGWLQQSAVHCWYCGGGTDALSGPEIHFGWFFLPWHRAYLYFHERMLGQLIDDPTFRLPYWDWDRFGMTPSRQAMPPIYTQGNLSSNSLNDPFRGASPIQQMPFTCSNPYLTYRVLSQSSFETFGGVPNTGNPRNQGQLEATQHDRIHNFVGLGVDAQGKFNPAYQPLCGADMGDLSTAARDPIFFAHHGNIDRFWDMWKNFQPGRENPTDDFWQGQGFLFYDENARWVSIQVSDVLDTRNLGYTYASLQTSLPPKKPPLTAPKLDIESAVVVSGKNGIPLKPNGNTYKVPLKYSKIKNPSPKKYFLKIQGIQIAPNDSAQAFVFLNAADNPALELGGGDISQGVTPSTLQQAIASSSYLGSIGSVRSRSSLVHLHKNHVFGVTLEVPLDALYLTLRKQRIIVSIVPVNSLGQPAGGDISFQSIVFEARDAL